MLLHNALASKCQFITIERLADICVFLFDIYIINVTTPFNIPEIPPQLHSDERNQQNGQVIIVYLIAGNEYSLVVVVDMILLSVTTSVL